jgi:magnesium chelatase subunit H
LGWSATTEQVAPWVFRQLSETYVVDAAMRERLAALNPTGSARSANRLREAHDRGCWSARRAKKRSTWLIRCNQNASAMLD